MLNDTFDNSGFNIISDISISKQNIKNIDVRQNELFEIRNAILSELSYTICQDNDASFDTIKKGYDSIFHNSGTRGDNKLKNYPEYISVIDKISFCRYYSKSKQSTQEISAMLFGEEEKTPLDIIGKVAYMKNPYTDSAYLIFSKSLTTPRSSYFSSFQSVCEEVYSGSCEYCILPIESSNDGKLMSFYSMIDKYELKITSVCTIRHSDNQKFTKFALLRKSISATGIFNASPAYLNKRSIEIRVSQTSQAHSPLDNILFAANACSLKLQRIDSLPLSYNDNLLGYYVVLTISHTDFKTFLTYLSLEHPESYIVGIYTSHT
jgi:prephenate dehydratase